MDISPSLEKSRILINRGQKREARSLRGKIVTYQPNSPDVYILFGEVAVKREHAIYCLEQALKINPNNLIARSELANYRSGPRTNRPERLFIVVFGFLIHLSAALIAWVSAIFSSDSSSPGENQPYIIYEETEKKFGFTESERRQIWEDIIRAEDKADVEAIQAYPDMTPLMDWRNLFDELADLYKMGLAQKLGLSMEQLQEIGYEGIEIGWPFPPLP